MSDKASSGDGLSNMLYALIISQSPRLGELLASRCDTACLNWPGIRIAT